MTDDDRIDAWIRTRREAAARPAFADRVIARGVRRRRVLATLAVAGATVVAALRIAAAFTPFIAQ